MAIIRTKIKSNTKKAIGGKTVYHLNFHGGKNHYFGSIAAIFDKFTSQEIGISKTALWNYGLDFDRPYQNKVVTIRKGIIHRKKGNRQKPV